MGPCPFEATPYLESKFSLMLLICLITFWQEVRQPVSAHLRVATFSERLEEGQWVFITIIWIGIVDQLVKLPFQKNSSHLDRFQRIFP